MVNLYVSDITNLPDPDTCPELLQPLTIERREKIAKMRQSKNRRQSLGAGLLLEKVLSRYGMRSQDVYLDECGKPQIEGLFFNLSHSGELVICAVSGKAVGCDVEQQGKAPRNLAKRFFCENEQRYLSRVADDKYDEALYRLWTLKESYMKYTGEGMRLPLDAFEILLDNEVKVLRGGQIQPCFIKEYVTDGYRIAVCAAEQEFADIIWENM